MSRIDLVLVGCIVPFVLRGLWRGFVREVVALAGLAAGAVLAARNARPIGRLIETRSGIDPEPALALAAAGVFLIVMVIAAVLGRVARRVVQAIFLGPIDRVLGGTLGLAQGTALVGLACLGVLRLAPASPAANAVESSRLGRPLAALGQHLVDALVPHGDPAVERAV